MSRALPPLGWFRSFEAAARCQSFTLAARELSLTQSAVSQQIRALEIRLGCALFVRKPRGIALTDDGRQLLPQVEASLEGLRLVVDEVARLEPDSRLTVAASVSVAQWVMAPRLNEFLGHYPGTSVRLITSVWPDHVGDIRADVHIRFGPALEQPWVEQLLCSRDMILVAAPSLMATHDASASADWLKACRIIYSVGTTDTWSRHAAQFGTTSDQGDAILVDSHGLAIDLAHQGAGVAFTCEALAKPGLDSGALVRAHHLSVQGTDGYWVSVDERSVSPRPQEFADWLVECLVTK
jgi:DNA-binding transcriptional LysR family regulator